MRILALAGAIGLALSSPAAPAMSPVPAKAAAYAHIVKIAQGCGRGYHWVPRHRGPYGGWVQGHCAPN